MQLTGNLGLKKPDGTDVVNIQDFNDNADILDVEIKKAQARADEAFQSASDGKSKIATAITGKGVSTNSSDTFTKMATNIGAIITDPSGDATAIAGDLLAGKTAYSKNAKITGTMPDRGTVNHTLPINGTYTIPAGKHSGTGKVTQAISTKGAATITPKTTNQTIASGQYLSGAQTIKGDANLVPSKLPSDLALFGVQGTRSLGKKFASGTGTASDSVWCLTWSGYSGWTSSSGVKGLKVTGIGFIPSVIIITSLRTGGHETLVYNKAGVKVYVSDVSDSATILYTNNTTSVVPMALTTSGAYVDNTGFHLPLTDSTTTCSWWAWE